MRVDTRRWRIVAPLMIALAAVPAVAQEEAPEEFGGSLSITAVSAASFQPETSGGSYQDVGAYRASTPATTLRAGVSLPSGVSVERFSLVACDFDNDNDVAATLLRCPVTGQGCLVTLATVNSAPGGCAAFEATPAPFTIDNNGQFYWIQVSGTNGVNATLGAVRLHWRRQVSPAPPTASFNDVPTNHIFFRFVQALVAAGITGGCGNGNYCPDAPVTRGQMATFLALALGLHTPN